MQSTEVPAGTIAARLIAIFVDANQAFYAVLRPIVLPALEGSDEAIVWLFRRLNMGPDAFHELQRMLGEITPVEECDLPPSFTADLLSTFSGTHFTMQGSRLIGQATKGTRPGHPYADLVFSFIFSQHPHLQCHSRRR